MRIKPPSVSVRSRFAAALWRQVTCPSRQVSNNQLTGYSPPVNSTLIYANTNNLLHFGIVIPVRDHAVVMARCRVRDRIEVRRLVRPSLRGGLLLSVCLSVEPVQQ